MRAFQFAMVLALAGLASVAGRSLKQTNGTTCTAAPGTICAPGTALVGGVSNAQQCIQPIQPTSTDCAGSLLNFLSSVVNVDSAAAAGSGTCAMTPCCDDNTGATECATVGLGCIADLKLCVGGAAGTLLTDLLGDALDIDLVPGPITAPAA